MPDAHATDRETKLRLLVEMWNDAAAQDEGSATYTAKARAAAKRRCAWELESILDGKDA